MLKRDKSTFYIKFDSMSAVSYFKNDKVFLVKHYLFEELGFLVRLSKEIRINGFRKIFVSLAAISI